MTPEETANIEAYFHRSEKYKQRLRRAAADVLELFDLTTPLCPEPLLELQRAHDDVEPIDEPEDQHQLTPVMEAMIRFWRKLQEVDFNRAKTAIEALEKIADSCNCTELCTCSDFARDTAKAALKAVRSSRMENKDE